MEEILLQVNNYLISHVEYKPQKIVKINKMPSGIRSLYESILNQMAVIVCLPRIDCEERNGIYIRY